MAGTPGASVVAAAANARQRLVACPALPVEHGLDIGQMLGGVLELCFYFVGLLGVQALSLGHGEHGTAVRAAHLVHHFARLEAVPAAFDSALAGARGFEGPSAADGGARHATIPR